MKKFALALMAAAAAVFGAGMVADAYPPPIDNPTVSTSSPAPGGSITVSSPCVVPETVTFAIPGDSATATCEPAATGGFMLFSQATTNGVATATLTAPTAPGAYTITITGSTSGPLGTLSITVAASPTDPGGGLPATGSDGIGTTTWIAGGLLIAGLGLFAVATVRRRQTATA